MNKAFLILRKHIIIILVHIMYSVLLFFAMFHNRQVVLIDLDKLTDIEFIKGLAIDETKRVMMLGIISAIFLSVIYHLIANCIQNKKINIRDFGKGILSYSIPTLFSILLWIPLFLIFLVSIGIISIPSVVIVFPLLKGQESLFIPAIVLWIVTFIFILFGILLFSLYMTFWYPSIFLITKNIFSAFKQSKQIVNGNYWRLLLFSIFLFLNFTGLLFVDIYAFILLYKSINPLHSTFLWAAVVILGIIATILKTYSFIFLNEQYLSEYTNSSMEQDIQA